MLAGRRVLISNYIEWAIRAATILVSIFQFLIITSRTANHCAYTMGLLMLESQWLMVLVQVQVLKVLVFSVWQIKLHGQEFHADEERISSIKSARPTAE